MSRPRLPGTRISILSMRLIALENRHSRRLLRAVLRADACFGLRES